MIESKPIPPLWNLRQSQKPENVIPVCR